MKLEHTAQRADLRIAIVLHMARGCVWLTRRILWALMHAGTAISCFMLRQMEFDADSYEAKVAGSDVFEATAARLRVLNVATQTAYEDVRQSWASNRLPENLPLLIDHKASSLPAELLQKLAASAASAKTGWFDTHPCDAERNRAARQLNEPGVFHVTAPASRLFADFTGLSKTVTRHQYEQHFKLEFTEQNLMAAEEILRESAASTEADAMIRKYYGSVNVSLKPLLVPDDFVPVADEAEALGNWREARRTSDALRAEAEKCSAECVEHQRRLASLVSANGLARAGFKLKPEEFGLPETVTSPGEQATVTRLQLHEGSAALSARLARLEPFMAALRQRVTLALRLAAAKVKESSAEPVRELPDLVRLLAAVGAEMQRAQEMGSRLNAFLLLARNRGNHSNPAQVDTVASALAAELRAFIVGIQARLQPFTYPFPHARGRMTVAEYARSEKPAESEWQRVFADGSAHVERLFPLHYRLVGRVLALADAAEKRLENESANDAQANR